MFRVPTINMGWFSLYVKTIHLDCGSCVICCPMVHWDVSPRRTTFHCYNVGEGEQEGGIETKGIKSGGGLFGVMIPESQDCQDCDKRR